MSTDIQFQYILVDCGYTARLLDHTYEMYAKFPKGVAIVGIYDCLWGNGTYSFGDKVDEKAILSFLDKEGIDTQHGTILLRVPNMNLKQVSNVISILMDCDHCGFFDWDNVLGHYIVEMGNKKILYSKFDTESG